MNKISNSKISNNYNFRPFMNTNQNKSSISSNSRAINYGNEYLFRHKTQNENSKSLFSNVLGKIWNIPNTIVGLAWGLVGTLFGAKITTGNNAIQFENHPFMNKNGGITLGNVIAYGSETSPAKIGEHEMQHTYQGEALGPAYLPAHLFEGIQATILDGDWHGQHNDLEAGPQANPARPWSKDWWSIF